MFKEATFRIETNLLKGVKAGPFTATEHIAEDNKSRIDSFYEDHVREYSAYDIKDLYGITFLEFMKMTVEQSDLLIGASKKVSIERELARVRIEKERNKDANI